ncbi:hypothetical protein WN71_038025 [Streptomyces mangrovisoli]|uniref:Uncharacterized protein n=1 Tax=Streptomyces mangrovisoli TaxID=1428628 RepID=A0A1J4NK05_9ACTN|nr:hypothetical protein WN71_038025 [Streptomyces mangrovisoli]
MGSSAAVWLESHITGCGASKTVPPEPVSVAVRPPPAVSFSFTEEVSTGSWSVSSSGLAAAFAFLTTSTCEKPSALAVTLRSTPGRTSV